MFMVLQIIFLVVGGGRVGVELVAVMGPGHKNWYHGPRWDVAGLCRLHNCTLSTHVAWLLCRYTDYITAYRVT